MLLVFTAGSGTAWGVHLLTATGEVQGELYFEYFPIFIFMITAGMVFNYKAELIRQERMKAVSEATSSISGELRVPLQIIRTGAIGLRKYLPELVRGYRLARQNGLPITPIEDQHLDALAEVPERVETEIEHALAVTSMLLMNAGELPIDSTEMKVCSISSCIDQALRRYPFRSERERARVVWRKGRGFEFRGAENLMVHVLLNLIKNALESVSAKGQGNVYLELRTGDEYNSILVRDTGNGLPHLVLNQLLNQKTVNGAETLRGTSFRFCNMVAEAFGGKISAESEHRKFTSITIRLPVIQPEAEGADSADSENLQEDPPREITA
jgi:two-component system CAI-1 autoinducer sensor kinase/phosphatase CqsS